MIADTAVLDVRTGERAEHVDVLVKDGRVAAIGPTGTLQVPEHALRFDGAGATVLPGLVDSHVHSGAPVSPPWRHPLPDQDRILQAYLFCGVTTVVDTGGMDDVALRLRDAIEDGARLGPRIFGAGPVITAAGGHPIPMLRVLPWWQRMLVIPRHTRAVRSVDDVGPIVEEVRALGADFLKVVVDRLPDPDTPRLSVEQLRELGTRAQQAGLRMIAHVGTGQDALDAARAGAAAWVHGPSRGRLSDEQVRELAGFGIPMVATLVVFDHYGELAQGSVTPTFLELQTQGAELFAELRAPPRGDPDADRFVPFMNLLHRERQNRLDNIRRLHRAGVEILAGSDAQGAVVPGASLHRELRLLVEAGLTPLEAIQAATVRPARFLTQRLDPPFGVIAPGKVADLLLVEGDPLQDIRILSRIRAVLHRGRLLERHPVPQGPRRRDPT